MDIKCYDPNQLVGKGVKIISLDWWDRQEIGILFGALAYHRQSSAQSLLEALECILKGGHVYLFSSALVKHHHHFTEVAVAHRTYVINDKIQMRGSSKQQTALVDATVVMICPLSTLP